MSCLPLLSSLFLKVEKPKEKKKTFCHYIDDDCAARGKEEDNVL